MLALALSFALVACEPEPLADRHATVVAEALRLRQAVGEHVWPGFSKIETPVLLQVEDRQYLIGFPQEVEGHETVQTPRALGEALVQVGPRQIPADLVASFPVHDAPAVVIAAPEALGLAPSQWVLKAAHEMFHVMQAQHGEFEKVRVLAIGPEDDASWQLDFPFPYEDVTVRRLVHLQAWPCFAGAEMMDDAEARYAAGVAVEASSVLREYLRASGAPEKSADYAAFQAWKEGVAMWIERETARAAAEHAYQPSPDFSALNGYVPFQQVWQEEYERQKFLAKHAGGSSKSRTMFYHLGMAKAMLLERLEPGWKKAYFTRDMWLDDMLEEARSRKPGVEPSPQTQPRQ